MNNHDFNSDLESILAEFAAYSGRISGETPADKQEQPAYISEPIAEKPPLEEQAPAPVQQSKAAESAQQAEYYVDVSMLTGFLKNRQGELGQ